MLPFWYPDKTFKNFCDTQIIEMNMSNDLKQAGAELCQAQGKFRRVRLGLDLCLI